MLRKTKRLFPALGIVVLSFLLLMGSVSAVVTNTEYFDTDTVGANPSEYWYTYLNSYPGKVSNTQDYSAPNSLKLWFNGVLDYHALGIFSPLLCQQATQDVRSLVKFRLYLVDNNGNNTFFQVYNVSVAHTLVKINFDDHNATHAAMYCYNGSTYQFDRYVSYNTWHSFEIDIFAGSAPAPVGGFPESYYITCDNGKASIPYHFNSSQDWYTRFAVQNFGTGSYIDNLVWVHADIDFPSSASLVSPANNTWLPSSTANLAVKVWDNDSTPITVDFYVYYINFGEWDNLTSSFAGTSMNVTSGATAYLNLTALCPGATYGWFVRLKTASSVFYPLTGYDWSGDAGNPDPSHDYVWLFHPANNSYPVTVIAYPADGATYTSFDWQKAGGHTLSLSTSDAEGDSISLTISIHNLYGTVAYLSLDSLHGIANGTYSIDLTPWITFDNMTYNITVISEDDAHCVIAGGNSTWSAFTIGVANTRTHLSVKDCYPPDKDDNAIGAINTGVTFYACTNITDASYPTIWCFLVDMDKTLTTSDKWSYIPVTAGGSRFCAYSFDYTDNPSLWHYFTFGKGYLQVRHTYRMYVGIYTSGSAPGDTIRVQPSSRIEADFIYDLSARGCDFSYEWQNFYIPKVTQITEDLASGDSHFVGVTWEFSTYPVGESPTDNDAYLYHPSTQWGNNLFAHVDPNAVTFLGLIAGLVVVASFSLMPYLLIKKKYAGRNIAMPITVMFAGFGLVVAYSLGFFPLWIFVPPVFIVMIILVYKVTAWVTSRKQLIGGEEGGA